MKLCDFFGKLAAHIVYGWFLLFYRPVLTDEDGNRVNPESSEPAVYIANHTDHKDGLLMMTLFRKQGIYTLCAKDWYEKKPFTGILAANNVIPIDRYGLDTSWLRTAVGAVRKGSSVLIFPEGHISKDGIPDEFKSGFLILSDMTGAKIVTICHQTRYRFLRPVKLIASKPEIPGSRAMTADTLRAESERFRERVLALQGKL